MTRIGNQWEPGDPPEVFLGTITMSEHSDDKFPLTLITTQEKIERSLLCARSYRSSLLVQKTLLQTLTREVNNNLKRITMLIEGLEGK